MTVTTLKDLSDLFDLCRKKGVETIEIDGIKVNFGETKPLRKRRSSNLPEDPETPEAYTAEETLLWSSSQLPPVGET